MPLGELLMHLITALLLLTLGIATRTGAAHAAAGENSQRGRLLTYEAYQLEPSLAKRNQDALAALEYDPGEVPSAFSADFNGDGVVDYLIRSSHRLCGTGGCPHILVDGKTDRHLGDFFGGIAILERRINRHPVIQVVSKYDINATHLTTFVYADGRYRQVAYALLEARGMDIWFKALSK